METNIDEKKEALARFLDVDPTILTYDGNIGYFTTENDGEYRVLTDEEADEAVIDRIKNDMEDMGLELFSDDAKRVILEWFTTFNIDDEIYNDYMAYADDIELEPPFLNENKDKYENRLQEEMAEQEVSTKEEFVEKLKDTIDPQEWLESLYGKNWYKYVDEGLFDITFDYEKIAEFVVNCDGRGLQLASWDGNENEEEINGTYYYIYCETDPEKDYGNFSEEQSEIEVEV